MGRRQTSVEILARKHDRPVVNIIQEYLELMPGNASERNKPSACLSSTWGTPDVLETSACFKSGSFMEVCVNLCCESNFDTV